MSVYETSVEVQQLTAHHIEAAQTLILRVFTEQSGAETVAKWYGDIRAMETEYIDSERQAGFVALDGGRVIGAAIVRQRCPRIEPIASRYDPATTCELGRMTVEPDYRRRGVALQLAEAARQWASVRYAEISLHSNIHNKPALRLWRSICDEVYTAPDGSVYFELAVDRPIEPRRQPESSGTFGGVS